MGLPVALTMGMAGLAALLVGSEFPQLAIAQQLFNGINAFPLMAVPLSTTVPRLFGYAN